MPKTSKEIIDKWNALQVLLIRKSNSEYPHQIFEKELWYSQEEYDKLKADLESNKMNISLTPSMGKSDTATLYNINTIKRIKKEYFHNSNNKPRNILKRQCLNIVFMSSKDSNLENSNERDRLIKISQKLFNELEEANYYGW